MNSESEEPAAPVYQTDGRLWCDKYAPKRYIDLLTDDITNRKVMTWLKSWDNIAFPERGTVDLRPPTVGRKSANPFVVKQNLTTPQTIDQEFNKANRKILMLFGAPGTGKSTLAKVLATQVGYEIREVNASDKRNGEELINEIKNAMTTNAHFNRSGFDKSDSDQKKPVCLILDEIDGALGGGPDQNKGMGLVADFLKKCIRETEWGKRAESKLDDLKRRAAEDEDMDDGDGSDKDEEEKKA